jgi:hypothetical protein
MKFEVYKFGDEPWLRVFAEDEQERAELDDLEKKLRAYDATTFVNKYADSLEIALACV